MDFNRIVSESICQQGKVDDIDLALSLCGSLQREAHPSGNFECGYIMHCTGLNLHSSSVNHTVLSDEDDDGIQGAQSKERWSYVKVNMDGVVVGRKVCLVNHSNYCSLARELEDMFGRYSKPKLQLFGEASAFSLVYEDRNGIWKSVGDSPWKDFVDGARRLRISPKNKSFRFRPS
ncbi:hypothetical protein H6P81_010497 [Aristolochia fimbriata]|uniref:Auxin-responsive protein n=1 Tax=Aristolochia fimbriata TaxID=158543 RepID=A0AAV7ENY5_ARIFI|nr:hypothetical protein H6P81_010497 [Aristolochia fimbriata]